MLIFFDLGSATPNRNNNHFCLIQVYNPIIYNISNHVEIISVQRTVQKHFSNSQKEPNFCSDFCADFGNHLFWRSWYVQFNSWCYSNSFASSRMISRMICRYIHYFFEDHENLPKGAETLWAQNLSWSTRLLKNGKKIQSQIGGKPMEHKVKFQMKT